MFVSIINHVAVTKIWLHILCHSGYKLSSYALLMVREFKNEKQEFLLVFYNRLYFLTCLKIFSGWLIHMGEKESNILVVTQDDYLTFIPAKRFHEFHTS